MCYIYYFLTSTTFLIQISEIVFTCLYIIYIFIYNTHLYTLLSQS